MDILIEFLQSQLWSGVSGLTGVVSLIIAFVTLWLAIKQAPRNRIKTLQNNWYPIAAVLALILLIYAIFVLSIIVVDYFTADVRILLYASVAVASVCGTIIGIIWTTLIQKGFRQNSRKSTSKQRDNLS